MTLKNRIFFKTLFLGALTVLFLTGSLALKSPKAYAGGLPATSCDPEYMDALEARAYMEAQREIAQNKNLIFKPDSVLEYSCFGSFLNRLAGANLFSEEGCCGTAGLGSGSLDAALQTAVGSVLMTYLGNNFNNTFLNGRSPLDYTFTGVAGGGYECDRMQQVWDTAKCMNFFDEGDHDGFYDFSWYITHDPRTFNLAGTAGPRSRWDPAGTGAGANSCGAGFISTGDTNVAYNDQAARYLLPAENPWSDNNTTNDFTPYADDPVNSYYQMILPLGDPMPGTATTVACAAPILTGVCVRRGPGSTEYPDGVCPNPGCHYQPPGGTTCASSPAASWCVGP